MRAAWLLVVVGLGGCTGIVRHALEGPRFTHRAGDRLEAFVPGADGTPLHTVVRLPKGEGAVARCYFECFHGRFFK